MVFTVNSSLCRVETGRIVRLTLTVSSKLGMLASLRRAVSCQQGVTNQLLLIHLDFDDCFMQLVILFRWQLFRIGPS